MITPRKELIERVANWLQKEFPPEDGWEISGKKEWKGYKIDFVIESKTEKKRIRNVLKIAFSGIPTLADVRNLNAAARRMSGRYVKIGVKIMAIPSCDNENKTRQIEKELKGFELYWV